MRHFDPAYVSIGSSPEVAFFGLMSAPANSGHNAVNAFQNDRQLTSYAAAALATSKGWRIAPT